MAFISVHVWLRHWSFFLSKIISFTPDYSGTQLGSWGFCGSQQTPEIPTQNDAVSDQKASVRPAHSSPVLNPWLTEHHSPLSTSSGFLVAKGRDHSSPDSKDTIWAVFPKEQTKKELAGEIFPAFEVQDQSLHIFLSAKTFEWWMFPVTCFPKQYIKFININGTSTTPLLNLSVLFIFQAGAGFTNDSFIKIRKQLQKYFALCIQINVDLEKSNFPKIISCICWLIQISLSHSFLEGSWKAELFPIRAPLGHADGRTDGQILAPLARRFVSAWKSKKEDLIFIFFPNLWNTIMSKRDSVNY